MLPISDLKKIKTLSGHSGCVLTLYEGAEGVFVRKSSGSVEYNPRLKRQFIKQLRHRNDRVRAPKIFRYGILNCLFAFDMEFVYGTTLSERFKSITINEINELISLFFLSYQSLGSEAEDEKIRYDAGPVFKRKLISLGRLMPRSDALIRSSLGLLLDFDFSDIPGGDCCGDLTLENIMISQGGEVYVIDLLDSFYNSWLIDAAKLLQDLELKWSYRYSEIDLNLELRLETAKQIFINRILRLKNGLKCLVAVYYVLLMNVLRIVPYANDDVTHVFLRNAIEKILAIINDMEK